MSVAQQNLSNNLLRFLEQGRHYKIAKGNIIQSSDTRHVINLIKKGYIKRYMIANDGSLKVQGIWGPGDIFPLTVVLKALFNQEIYQGPEVYHYQTMSDVELYTIDQTALAEEVNKNPILYRDLLFQAGKRLESNIQRLENLSLRTSYHRLAHQLLYLAIQEGAKTVGGIQISIPLSHQDIADNLSITRETVSTSMKELRDKGLIITRSSSKFIIVPSLKKLEEEAYS